MKDKKQSDLWQIISLFSGILLLWTGYRLFSALPEWVDEFVAKPLLYIVPLFIGKYIVFPKTVSISIKNIRNNLFFGFGIGLLYFFLFTALTALGKKVIPIFNPEGITLFQLFLQACISLATGYTEEIVFRKYILEKSLSIFHDSILANSFTAFLFTIIHLPIILFVYKYPLPETISYLSLLFLSGFIYGLVYLKNKSLVAASITHAVWNFFGTVIH